jgi:multidrug efflux system membrane fusion protein
MAIDYASESDVRAFGGQSPESPRKKRTLVRVVVYLVIVAAAGFVTWRVYQSKQQAAANTVRQAAMLQSRPVPVQVTPAEQKPMPIYLTALGTVTPYMSVTVKARVSGELLPVKFVEGQEVRQGETILEIDPKPYIAALDQAKGTETHDEALLQNAQAEYARYKSLYDAGVTSKETLDADAASLGQYQGAIASDKAAVENAQLQLNWCTIQSPISGKIGLRLVDPGNLVAANTTNLVIINQLRPIAVYFTLPENLLPEVLQRLREDRRMPVDAYDRGDVQRLAQGQLLTADNQIDTTTGTDRMKAVFANQNEALFPNQFVNIHLILENRPNALVVPSAAIQTGNQGAFVWTATKNEKGTMVATMQTVKVALSEGQVTILDRGVTAGADVVVDGADRLRPGQPVVINKTRQAPSVVSVQSPDGTTEGSPKVPMAASPQTSHTASRLSAAQGKNAHQKRTQQ